MDALAVNIDSRHLDPGLARERAGDAVRYLRQIGCSDCFLKIDSTLRGNIGAEISGMLGALGLELAVVAPAYPEAGRTTVGGFQLVDGTPVALSSYGQDPLAPATESHLPTLLESTGLKAATIDLRTVLEGWEAIAGALSRARAAGARAVVVDAVRTEDLMALARAIGQGAMPVLPVGSAGLAEALMRSRPGQAAPLRAGALARRVDVGILGEREAEVWPIKGRVLGRTPPVLVVSGSPNPTTLEQIKHLGATARLVLVDVRQLLLTDTEKDDWALHQELAGAGRQALQGLLAGRDVVVTTAVSAEQVASDRELGRELGMTRGQMGRNLAYALGALARHLQGQADIGGVVVAGGETASAVCHALPGERLEIREEVLPFIPLARVVGRNLRLVTKSGGFGAPETLRIIVEYLRQTEEVA